MEESPEISSGHQTTFYRELDTRSIRWWSVDPEFDKFFSLSPYISMGNSPIMNLDPDGNVFAYYSRIKKFDNRMKRHIAFMRIFGPKELRQRIKAIDNSADVVYIIAGDVKNLSSAEGSYDNSKNVITVPLNKAYYKILRVAKKSNEFVQGSEMTTLGNEISHAEDDIKGNKQTGVGYIDWTDHKEEVPNYETESNENENLVRKMLLKPLRSNSHYSVAGSDKWTNKERAEFKRIVRVFGNNRKRGEILKREYLGNPNKKYAVKEQIRTWAQ